jgi:translation initiation factor IF-2
MPEKKKKIRLYKFAAEYNLSTDKLLEFLVDKGFDIKSHMALLTDDMLDAIEDRFKKDIEAARKHYKKIDDFQKKFSTRKASKKEEEKVEEVLEEEETTKEVPQEEVAENVEEVKAEEAAPEKEKVESEVVKTVEDKEKIAQETEVKEQETPSEELAEKTSVDEKPVVKKSDEEVPQEEVVEQKEVKPEEAKADKEDVKETKQEAEKEPEKIETETSESAEPKKYLTDAEKELENGSGGLKVLGKMDLDAHKKKHKKKNKNKKNDPKKEEPKKTESKAKPDVEVINPAEVVEVTPSKKKKKLKAKKRKEIDSKSKEKGETPRGKRKSKKIKVDQKEVEAAIKRTILGTDDNTHVDRAALRKKKRIEKREIQEQIEEELAKEKQKLQVTEFISVNELANLMDVSVAEVIGKCMGLGLMVSINQRLDFETISLVADEFGFEVVLQEEVVENALEDVEDPEDSLVPRPPVVTIMGHVDHGKTSLLDFIRKANVVAGEAGGITQHIGAYHVKVDDEHSITFLDTPGHEAFTAMRARGAQVTDIVVIIIAADDAVMPQTVEAINHAQAAGVPMVFAINKIDKPGANPEKIRQQLSERNILLEDWGGKYQSAEISAKSGLNVESLLEKIILEAEMLELKANPNRKARGAVIEAQLEKGRGVVSTVLVQKGTLEIGNPFVAGNFSGRVRAMYDERGKKVKKAGPSIPVVVTGFEGVPQAGDMFVVVESEKEAHNIAIKRQQIQREQDQRQIHMLTLEDIARQISTGEVQDLNIVVKGDVDGSVEALADSFMKLSNEEVQVRVIHKGVGAISESDVLLAAASDAIIIGFHVRPNLSARKLAEQEKVEIRLYNVIYNAIEELKSALEGMLKPIISEEVVGTVEVRDIFKVPKVGTIAGCYVLDGKIGRNDKIRLFRDGIKIYEGDLASLKRFKDDAKEVVAGYECGLNIANFNDVKVGDMIESFKIVETKKKLD